MAWLCTGGGSGAGLLNSDLVVELKGEPVGGTGAFQAEELCVQVKGPACAQSGTARVRRRSSNLLALARAPRLCGNMEQINILFLAPEKEST